MSPAKNDQTSQSILSAAVSSIGSVGIARTTMEQVASVAGIGVATVYRRFNRKDNLVQQAIRYEAEQLLRVIEQQIVGLPTVEEALTEGFVAFLREANQRPLIRGIGDGNVVVGLPMIAQGGALLIEIGRTFAANIIVRFQDSGQLPQFDPKPVAEIFARIGHSVCLAPDGLITPDDPYTARVVVRDCLMPAITAHSQPTSE
ncbi:TetR/AcrR family transcriptional regulator [Tsukamurella sp. 8F]|uniref:TetR/AcrR family transcriptional regulator n=1 Tax=unclassified Tsukamurella TaxID=2633480 RepID=UPI0023B9EEE6|nr:MULTISPECIES: TetR/AcrR family transcriptional regulator [unclassified Tsukamurella]MDF0530629.1 TetR/AcrR family transcriptional regulator [Tsukamurella sp. 8J]MDF0587830.1 TetR/AcrR family transcriptional regulator [Tsukamurella sp. 8F]